MVQSPETVELLLSQIRAGLIPRGAEYAHELLELKKQEAASRGVSAEHIFLWDQSYYAHKQDEREKLHGAEVSEYFELHKTLAKLLQMFEHMFATRFKLVTPEDQRSANVPKGPLVWHEDVMMFSVWDGDTQEFMGYAYFDFFPREGKYTHVGHYSLQANFVQPDGTRFYPSSVLVMNYHKPSNDRPILLNLEDVRKLFHEIGHLVHALCTRTTYAGSQYVDRDFVEAPSLMFEQFFCMLPRNGPSPQNPNTINLIESANYRATMPHQGCLLPLLTHISKALQYLERIVARGSKGVELTAREAFDRRSLCCSGAEFSWLEACPRSAKRCVLQHI